MDTILWIAQVLMAFVFFMSGIMKVTQPEEKLKERMGFIDDLPKGSIRLIGALEVAGAIGLILPWLLDILPILTPIAAVGLVLTMIGAALTHLRRKEYPGIAVNLVLLGIVAFIAVGRFGLIA